MLARLSLRCAGSGNVGLGCAPCQGGALHGIAIEVLIGSLGPQYGPALCSAEGARFETDSAFGTTHAVCAEVGWRTQ
jgi:hypothetical protein